jgi:8-oxo-dGTP pyrophosphatase MutT (NUDIX family)
MSCKVLIIIYGPSDGTEMVRLAANLKNRKFAVSVHYSGSWQNIAAQLDSTQLRGTRVTDDNGPVTLEPVLTLDAPSAPARTDAASREQVGAVRRLYRRLPVPLRDWLWSSFYRAKAAARNTVIAEVLQLRRDLADCARMLDGEAPDALVLPLEAVGHHSGTLASVAHRRGIPTVIAPYSVPVNIAEIGERFYYDKKYFARRPYNRLIAFLAPNWVRNYRGRPILRLEAHEIVARRLLGLSPAHPWDAGGLQFADAIAVENEAMAAFYKRELFPEEKLQVTGSVVDDVLADAIGARIRLRRELAEELGLAPDKPLLLSALPPDFTGREGSEFVDYGVLVEHWFAVLGRLRRFNVIVRLHPSLNANDFARWNRPGLRIAQRDTGRLIPLCDLYVASMSSTIRWAAMCGIPVVNYDLYRFRYSDFAGILTVETKEAFSSILHRFDVEPDFLESVRAAQQRGRGGSVQLDGRAGERIGLLIERLATQAGTRRYTHR